MVAFASHTIENSYRRAALRFEKPLSRVRGNSAIGSHRARSFNSLNRIEMRLSIYESRDRLESFSRDPIGFEGSPYNLYEYVESNPLVGTDPLGLYCPLTGQGFPCTFPPRPAPGPKSRKGPCGKECRTDIQDPNYVPTRNGCSAPAPQGIGSVGNGVFFGDACNEHDDCYQTCGISQSDCDRQLLSDLYSACESQTSTWFARMQCRNVAHTFFNALTLVGFVAI